VDGFELPKLRYEDVSLRLDLPSEPGGNGNGETGEHARTWSSVSFKLEEGLSFGGPMAAPLQKKDVHDDDLRTFMRDPAATWLLVHSGVTFKGEQKRPNSIARWWRSGSPVPKRSPGRCIRSRRPRPSSFRAR